MSKELVYVISPVRQVTPEQSEEISRHARLIAERGEKVFNPVEDAPQDDATGYNIVMSELNFMYKASKEGGRVDILWNVGGKPSEGSRVDFGIAIALGLHVHLVTVFNEDQPTGPQITYKIIKEMSYLRDGRGTLLLDKLVDNFQKIKQSSPYEIDWNVEMNGEEEEWQRINLGLALGWMARNPSFRIKLGKLTGIDPPGKKSYPKVIKEIEKRQNLV